MIEEFVRRFGRRSFGKGGADKQAAMVIGTADQDFLPSLRMSWRQLMSLCKGIDLFRGQLGKNMPGKIAQERVAQAVDAFEMAKKKDQPLQMRGRELAVDAVERMRDRVNDVFLLEVDLEIKNVVAQGDDLFVLGL